MNKLTYLITSILLLAQQTVYGGQAVVGGVLMKGKKHYAISVYAPKGLKTKLFPFNSLTQRYKLLGIPFIRGIILLIEMMILGFKAITYSADLHYEEEPEEQEEKPASQTLTTIVLAGSVIISLLLAVLLFKFLPLGAATLLDGHLTLSNTAFNSIVGGVKLLIFVGYLWLVGFYPDMKDLFSYHGAEHKTINAYEHAKKLTPQETQKESTRHLRCGTTFMFVVVLLTIVVSLFIPKTLPFWTSLGLRLALVPLIAAISYELQRITARHNISLLKPLLWPGLWLQRLTTRQPSRKHLRAGIASLKSVQTAEDSNTNSR